MLVKRTHIGLLVAALLVLLLPLGACQLKPAKQLVVGSGNVVTRTTPLGDNERGFALEVRGASFQMKHKGPVVDIIVDERLGREVRLETDDNVADCFSVTFDAAQDKILVTLVRPALLSPTEFTLTVGVPVRKLTLGGVWNFSYDCPSVRDCDVNISGAADGTLAFGQLRTLNLHLSGAADLKLSGQAQAARIAMSGAANVTAYGLAVEDAVVMISGTGDCEIKAVKTLQANISGLGSVTYIGDPVVTKRISGLGEVKQK